MKKPIIHQLDRMILRDDKESLSKGMIELRLAATRFGRDFGRLFYYPILHWINRIITKPFKQNH